MNENQTYKLLCRKAREHNIEVVEVVKRLGHQCVSDFLEQMKNSEAFPDLTKLTTIIYGIVLERDYFKISN